MIELIVFGSGGFYWYIHLKYTEVINGNITQTLVLCALNNGFQSAFSVDLLLSRIIPVFGSFCLNLILIRGLIKSKKNVSNDYKISSKEYSFAISLIAQNFISFVL